MVTRSAEESMSNQRDAGRYLKLLLALPNIHWQSLHYQADEAERLYQLLKSDPTFADEPAKDHENFGRMQIHALGAVIGAFAFVETQINDFFGKCNDPRYYSRLANRLLTETEIEIIRKASQIKGFEKIETLARYDEALRLAGREGFDKGREPYQSMETLRKLRNSLAHLQHSSIRANNEQIKKIERQLCAKSIEPAKIGPFPDSYLIGSTALWAKTTACEFFGAFCTLLYEGSPDSKKSHVERMVGAVIADMDDL